MKDKVYFVFDCESIGIHGECYAVAGGVYRRDGTAISEFKYATDPMQAQGLSSDREWVNQNIPHIRDTHRDKRGIRNAFWLEWCGVKAFHPDVIMAVECGWPVEARFLNACVDDDKEGRNFEGPYPLMEIATYMEAAGLDPMATYERLPEELPKHDPLCDARQSMRLLKLSLDILDK